MIPHFNRRQSLVIRYEFFVAMSSTIDLDNTDGRVAVNEHRD